jgi:hypothetical protein
MELIKHALLYGCGTWSLTLRMRVSENRVVRMFGAKMEKLAGYWRRLHNEELHNLYASQILLR